MSKYCMGPFFLRQGPPMFQCPVTTVIMETVQWLLIQFTNF